MQVVARPRTMHELQVKQNNNCTQHLAGAQGLGDAKSLPMKAADLLVHIVVGPEGEQERHCIPRWGSAVLQVLSDEGLPPGKCVHRLKQGVAGQPCRWACLGLNGNLQHPLAPHSLRCMALDWLSHPCLPENQSIITALGPHLLAPHQQQRSCKQSLSSSISRSWPGY